MNIILGFGPILFSGAIAGALASYFAPAIIKALKANFHHKRIDDLYDTYQHHPEKIAKRNPKLYEFFKDAQWQKCDCSCCEWMRKKYGKKHNKVEQAKKAA